MTHVDDWLEDPANKDHVAYRFLNEFRKPAIEKDHAWLDQNRPTVMWRGKRYTCVGASRMGDVWLKGYGKATAYYDHRVDIVELSDWQSPEKASEHKGHAPHCATQLLYDPMPCNCGVLKASLVPGYMGNVNGPGCDPDTP